MMTQSKMLAYNVQRPSQTHAVLNSLCFSKTPLQTNNFFNISQLHLAAAYGTVEQVCELLKNGADLFAKDKSGRSVFYLACALGNLNNLLVLEEKISKPISQTPFYLTNSGASCLDIAAEKKHINILAHLLESDINPDRKDKFGNTVLQRMVKIKQIESAFFLLESGKCNVATKNNLGNTLLHEAANSNFTQMASFLVRNKNLDMATKNNSNITPVQIAFYHAEEIFLLFEKIAREKNIDPVVNMINDFRRIFICKRTIRSSDSPSEDICQEYKSLVKKYSLEEQESEFKKEYGLRLDKEGIQMSKKM